MKAVILDSATLGDDIDLSPIKSIAEVHEYRATRSFEVEERIKNADAVIVNKIKLGRDNLKDAKNLRLICVTATGYDNIDTAYCKERGIALYNVPKYSTDSVSQITVAMALTLVCRLDEYRQFVNSGEYSRSGIANKLTPVYHELSSMTWGVVGGGAIGSRVANIAEALGCRVLMCRRKQDEKYETCSIDDLCRRSDVISLHVPLTAETEHLINEQRISLMKKNAIIINMARGRVADEDALVRAVEAERIGGIGIDVYAEEPFDTKHPYARILGRPNVCLTPHMAWGSAEARARCVSVVAQNILSFCSGSSTNRIV